MRLSYFIARRYLFSRKKQNAINIISAISTVGVAIGTTALIVILSVFNGIDLFLQKSTDSLTPDIVIFPAEGKFMHFDSTFYDRMDAISEIAYYNPVIEENALLKYGDRLRPVVVKGVTENFPEATGFTNSIVEGGFRLKDRDVYEAVVGAGVAVEVGLGLNFLTPMMFYYPDKRASSLNSALNTEYLFPAGIFSSQQEIDGKLVITDIDFARKLFLLDDEISKVELKLKGEKYIGQVKEQLQQLVGSHYRVEDKYELNRSFYAMMRSEKLVVFLILLFILLIASFNIVGSISMLILDKKEDLVVYKALGMPLKRIISIFKTEGNLITCIGAFIGVVLGVVICLLQENYGLIKLREGGYLLEAYPVKLIFGDIVLIIFTVLCIGYVASYFPVKYLVRKLIK